MGAWASGGVTGKAKCRVPDVIQWFEFFLPGAIHFFFGRDTQFMPLDGKKSSKNVTVKPTSLWALHPHHCSHVRIMSHPTIPHRSAPGLCFHELKHHAGQ
jgi:hypothetical protein